jgi:hypothetical protein
MNHNEAIRMRATERYTLGELPADEREAYEEHFFDCAECAMDIQAMSAFGENARELFASEPPKVAPAPVWKPGRDTGRGWWGRILRPVVAVPVFAALLLVVGYQTMRVSPQSGVATQAVRSFSLNGAESRGAAGARISVRTGESFTVFFDIPPSGDKMFTAYRCELKNAAGQMLRQVSVTAEQANKSVELLLPAGMMHAGGYSVVIAGERQQDGQLREEPVTQLDFEVSLEQ